MGYRIVGITGAGAALGAFLQTVAAFAGQPENPVGFAATPATAPASFTSTGASAGLWPGAYPGSLTAGSGPFTSGTPTNPTIVAFKDFQNGTTTLTVGAHDIIFVGCRFSYSTPNNSSGTNCVNLSSTDYNVQFIYCSWTPLNSFGFATTPNPGWPMSTASVNTVTQTSGVNCIDGADGYQFGLGAYSTSTNGSFMVQCDHCECWGFGNAFIDTITSSGQQNYYDCWVHDACNNNLPGGLYHQDGMGYFDGGINSTITASISGTTLTVTAISGAITAGDTVGGLGVALNTVIQPFLTGGTTGTGGLGTYALSGGAQTVPSETMRTGGGQGASNILIKHCTIAAIGNANAIAFQASISCYNNIQVINNYLSGFNNNLDLGHVTPGSTNLICTDNIFGTDCQWVSSIVYANPATLFTQSSNPTNLWRRNKLKVIPGTTMNTGSTPTWTSANDGQFIWPDQTLSTTDWPN